VQAAHVGVVGWSLGSHGDRDDGPAPVLVRSGIVWSSLAGNMEKFAMTMPGAQQAVKRG